MTWDPLILGFSEPLQIALYTFGPTTSGTCYIIELFCFLLCLALEIKIKTWAISRSFNYKKDLCKSFNVALFAYNKFHSPTPLKRQWMDPCSWMTPDLKQSDTTTSAQFSIYFESSTNLHAFTTSPLHIYLPISSRPFSNSTPARRSFMRLRAVIAEALRSPLIPLWELTL